MPGHIYASKDALLKAQEYGQYADDSAANAFADHIGAQELCDDDCVVSAVQKHNYRQNGTPTIHEETVRANSDLRPYDFNAQTESLLHPSFYQSYEKNHR